MDVANELIASIVLSHLAIMGNMYRVIEFLSNSKELHLEQCHDLAQFGNVFRHYQVVFRFLSP